MRFDLGNVPVIQTITMTVRHNPSVAAMPAAPAPRANLSSVSTPQVSFLRRILGRSIPTWMGVDQSPDPTTVLTGNVRHLRTKLSRLNLTEAAREAAALKAQFRREDANLYRQGREAEVLVDRKKNLGITGSGSTKLLTVNGVRLKS